MAKYGDLEVAVKQLTSVVVTDDLMGMGVQTGINHALSILGKIRIVDAVEVVRCQHCQEYDTLDNGLRYCKFFSKILEDAYYIPSPDGYCDRGKRRNDDG